MVSWKQQAKQLLTGIKMTSDAPMGKHTTFQVGGPADLLVEPENLEELVRVFDFCQEFEIPWFVLGLGSNLLVRDGGIRGIVLRLSGDFNQWEIDGNKVVAGAGAKLADLAKATAQAGLSGLEFACGIPGTVGGGVFMNAGAYCGELSEVVEQVQAYHFKEGVRWYRRDELDFAYRNSRFQSGEEVILRVEFKLAVAEVEATLAKVADLTSRRESKQPLDQPSAGSTFRRPSGYYVGPMIEEAGLKGYALGGAQVSSKHAGFVINCGDASAQDVLELITYIQTVIKGQYGVDLVPEVRVIGEESAVSQK